MKVLKRGTPPGEVVFRATCSTCSSELEFTGSEAIHTADRDGGMWKVDCPVCKALVWAFKGDAVHDKA